MKKFLTTLLCLIMVFTMMPMVTGVAFALEAPTLIIGDKTVVSGTNVENATGEGWSYSSTTNTLTLEDGFILTSTSNIGGIVSSIYIEGMEDLTIVAKGNATITNCDRGIYTFNSKLTISATNLEINATNEAIFNNDNNNEIVISTGTNLIANSSSSNNGISVKKLTNFGRITANDIYVGFLTNENGEINAKGNVGITALCFEQNGGKVFAEGTAGDGIFIASTATFTNGKVYATGTNGENFTAGINCEEKLNIPSNSKCEIYAFAEGNTQVFGITSGVLNIEGGKIIAIASCTDGEPMAPIQYGWEFDNPQLSFSKYIDEYTSCHISTDSNLIIRVSENTDGTNLTEIPNNETSRTSFTEGISNGTYKYVLLSLFPAYNVTFNMNNHGTPIVSQKVINGEKATRPNPAPSAESFIFGGWFKDQACSAGKEWNFETPITTNTNLYASWTSKTEPGPNTKPTGGSGYFDYEAYKANLEKLEKAEHEKQVAEVKKAIKNTEFRATSTKQTKFNGKKAIKLKWEVVGGTYNLSDFEGFDVFRSTKKNSGYGKTPFFTTKNWTYVNNKDLKAGKTYYYKVRAWKMIDGEKVYTNWSTKAWRTVK